MKGMSPMISVVLLVAIAVSVGIMVTTWITHWVTEQTTDVSVSCAVNTNYVIESVRWNISSSLNNTLLIKITNRGTQKLYGFGVVLSNGTKVVNLNSSSPLIDQGGISASNKLGTQESVYIKVNMTNTTLHYPGLGATLTEVRVTNDACKTVSQKTNTILTS